MLPPDYSTYSFDQHLGRAGVSPSPQERYLPRCISRLALDINRPSSTVPRTTTHCSRHFARKQAQTSERRAIMPSHDRTMGRGCGPAGRCGGRSGSTAADADPVAAVLVQSQRHAAREGRAGGRPRQLRDLARRVQGGGGGGGPVHPHARPLDLRREGRRPHAVHHRRRRRKLDDLVARRPAGGPQLLHARPVAPAGVPGIGAPR